MKTKLTFILFFSLIISVYAQDAKTWSLQECVDYAIQNNISVKQSELDIEISEENIVTANATRLPTLNASSSENFNFGSYIGNNGNRISRNTFGANLNVNAGITVFNGYRNLSTRSQAKLGLESSKLLLEKLKNDISLFVANNYLNILFNKESLKIAEEQKKVTEQQITQIEQLVESGVRARTDLLDAQAQLASDQERVVNAQNSIDLAILSLAQLLQVPHQGFDIQDVNIDLPSVALLDANSNEIYNKALEVRPEIKNAELDIENSVLDIKIAKSGYYPTVSIGAGLGTSYQHLLGEEDRLIIIDPDTGAVSRIPNGFGKQIEDNLGYNLGLSVSIPIFNGFRNKANVNRAIINNQKSTYRLEQEKQTLQSDIESAYADAKAALNQFEASQLSVRAQDEAFKNAQSSYDLGVMTSFEFEQVRNRLVNAQSALINAKYNFVFKTKLLEFYYGIPITIN